MARICLCNQIFDIVTVAVVRDMLTVDKIATQYNLIDDSVGLLYRVGHTDIEMIGREGGRLSGGREGG